jgi:hypothetical protein
MLLIIKSLVPSRSAASGIFAIQNQDFKGFQEGDPKANLDVYLFNLYSDTDTMEFVISQKGAEALQRISQADINRIVQSVRKVPHGDASTKVAAKAN